MVNVDIPTKNSGVAIMATNTPEMLEAHNAVPMIGAVLNSLNIRLDANTLAFILNHGEAKVLISDREFSPIIKEAIAKIGRDILLVDIDDVLATDGELIGELDYEALLREGDADEVQMLVEQYDDNGRQSPLALSLDLANVPLRWLDIYLGGDRGDGHTCMLAQG